MRIFGGVGKRRALSQQRRAWLAAPLALLVTFGCSGSKARENGFDELRQNAEYPYVSYLAGPGEDATDVRVDLDTGAIRVGLGPIDSQTVRRDTVEPNEMARGRELFLASRVAHYESLSGGSASSGNGGAAGEADVAQPASSGAPSAEIDDNAPNSGSERASDDTQIVVTFPPGAGEKVFLLYPPAGIADPQVGEVLTYFSELSTRYAP